MHPAIARLESGARTPIVNVIQTNKTLWNRWVKSYMKFAFKGGQSVELHKRVFGRQDCTFTGSEYRSWVWERPNWTVLVGRRGVEFDVSPNITPQQAMSRWYEYLRMLGL